MASESPAVMTIPLIILAIPAALGGYAFFASRFLTLPNETKSDPRPCR